MDIKRGTVVEITYYNNENGFTIGTMETKEEQFTIKGVLPLCNVGKSYELKGNFKSHPLYGEQFDFSEFVETMPTGIEEIENFLASGTIKGIGPKTARLIVEEFGDMTMSIIEYQMEKLCKIPGIGKKKAEGIHQSFNEQKEFIDISMYFQSIGASSNHVLKLYKAYGSDVINIIEENPYRLMDEIHGFGFQKADSIAQKIGINSESPFRIESGIKYGLNYFAGEGSSYVPQKELCEKVGELLDVPRETVENQLVIMAVNGHIYIDIVDEIKVVYLFTYRVAEKKVAKKLLDLHTSPVKAFYADIDGLIALSEKEKNITLSPNQKHAVKSTVANGVTVITGGPGTGKTTIINAIINIFKSVNLKVAIAAPTGRAAKRITETTGEYASTIHRLLEYNYIDEEILAFGKDENNPLEEDVVIIDEASMVDLLLMNGLLAAISNGTRLIIVGDSDQLPSVGVGNVLKDIIESEIISVVYLKEIFRQAKESLIVTNAHKINKGEYPAYNETGKDFFLMRRQREQEIIETIKELVGGRLEAYYNLEKALTEIQVLTPVRKGNLGTANLNNILQEQLNKPAPYKDEKKYGDKILRQGDKIMQIKNNYQIEWKKIDGGDGKGIFNGDIGSIVSISATEEKLVALFDENKFVTYEFSELEQIELAYAMTVHKSQGSEFPIVIFPVTWFPPVLATRNLLYTAITRGKTGVIMVGTEDKINGIIDNNRIAERYSGLKYRLTENSFF